MTQEALRGWGLTGLRARLCPSAQLHPLFCVPGGQAGSDCSACVPAGMEADRSQGKLQEGSCHPGPGGRGRLQESVFSLGATMS